MSMIDDNDARWHKRLWHALQIDAEAHGYARDWQNVLRAILFHPAVRMLCSYRLQRILGEDETRGWRKVLRRMLYMGNCRKSGCHISFYADIAAGVKFPHATGIVIGENVCIGYGSEIYQNVTIGTRASKRYGDQKTPDIGKHVTLYANAVVIGDIEVGEQSIIAAGALVKDSVAPRTIMAGNPAQSVKRVPNIEAVS